MKTTRRTILTGSQVVAETMRQLRADVVPVYPITPQTEIIDTFAALTAERKVDSEIVRVESEHAVMSAAVGAATAGARVMTASSSQGIALMWEVLGVAAGLRLPIVMAVGNRALSAPINIHCDHSDSMGTRDLGWIQIFCENVQEVYDHMLLATKLAEDKDIQLPAMVMQDGFVTTHALENLDVLADEDARDFVGLRWVGRSVLDTDHPSTWGALTLPEHQMEFKITQHEALLAVKQKYLEFGTQLSLLTGHRYPLFELYEGGVVDQLRDSETVMVFLNSSAGTAKEAVDQLRAEGRRVGLLKPILFRPFPYDEIRAALARVKRVIVYDRSMSYGASSPLLTEIRTALYGLSSAPEVEGRVYGLGGREATAGEIVESL